VAVYTASGAIGVKEGLAVLNGAAALAMTLVAPTVGLPSAGGDDGKELTIMDIAGKDNTVTTPADGLNGVHHIATWGGAAGDFQTLVAYNGSWYTAAAAGITIS
jgi:hypothetical protein